MASRYDLSALPRIQRKFHNLEWALKVWLYRGFRCGSSTGICGREAEEKFLSGLAKIDSNG